MLRIKWRVQPQTKPAGSHHEIRTGKSLNKIQPRRIVELRTRLVKVIDPIRGRGADLQDIIMKCTRKTIGEIGTMS